jgi:hypothetical protein
MPRGVRVGEAMHDDEPAVGGLVEALVVGLDVLVEDGEDAAVEGAGTAAPFLVGAGFFVAGIGIVIWNVVTVSLRQRATPDRLLGRVNSGYGLVGLGTRPLGATAGGVLGQVLGLRAVFIVAALVTLALLAGMSRGNDAAMDAAERDGGHS